MTTAWLYAYLYCHPGYHRVSRTQGVTIAWVEAIPYMSFAGSLDYLLIWSLFWPLSLLLPLAFGE